MDFGPQPRSATHFGINLCALIVGLATVGSLVHRMQGDLEPVAIVLLTTAAVGLVIAAGELWWRRGGLAPDAGLAASAIRTLDVRRVLTRLLGLAVTLGCIALAYWIFPEYHGDFYAPFWRFSAPALAVRRAVRRDLFPLERHAPRRAP